MMKLNDEYAGKKAILKDSYVLIHRVVPIQMIEANFKINKNSSQTSKKSTFKPNLCCPVMVNSIVEIKYSF